MRCGGPGPPTTPSKGNRKDPRADCALAGVSDNHQVRYFVKRLPDDTVDFSVKLHVLPPPLQPPGPQVFWELRGIVARLRFSSKHILGKWVKTQWPHWTKWWDFLHVPAHEFRLSARAFASPRKSTDDPLDILAATEDAHAHATEYCCSTRCIIGVLLYIAVAGTHIRRASAMSVLASLIYEMKGAIVKEHWLEPAQSQGCCACKVDESSGRCTHVRTCVFEMSSQFGIHKSSHLAQCLLILSSPSFRSCKAVRHWVSNVIKQLADAIDCEVHSLPSVPDRIPVLRGNTRARRLDNDAVHHMAVKVVQQKQARSATSYVKASGCVLAEGTARDQHKKTMSNYHWNGARDFHKVSQISLAADCSRLGGQETLTCGVYSWRLDKAMWLPPQAFIIRSYMVL